MLQSNLYNLYNLESLVYNAELCEEVLWTYKTIAEHLKVWEYLEITKKCSICNYRLKELGMQGQTGLMGTTVHLFIQQRKGLVWMHWEVRLMQGCFRAPFYREEAM